MAIQRAVKSAGTEPGLQAIWRKFHTAETIGDLRGVGYMRTMVKPTPIGELIQRGVAALNAKQFDDAIMHLRQALKQNSNNAEALFYLAASLAAAQRLEEAADAAAKSYRAQATFGTATFAADVALGRNLWDEGKIWLTRAHGHKPDDRKTLLRLADMHAQRDLLRSAADYYGAALKLKPDDFMVLRRYCYCAATQGLDAPIAALEAFIARNAGDAEQCTNALWMLLPYKEKNLRLAQGLSERANGFDDLHFRLATSELAQWKAATTAYLAKAPDDATAVARMAVVAIAHRDLADAERHLARLRPVLKNDVLTTARFNSEFFDKVNRLAASAGATLPPVETLVESPVKHASVFTASDGAYFDIYGWPFVRSFARHMPETHLRLHIFDLSETERPVFLARLAEELAGCSYSVTTETSGLRGQKSAPVYYHAIRFIRAAAFLNSASGPVCLTDMDMVFARSADTLFSCVGATDGQWMPIAGRVEVSNQIWATLMILAPTPRGRAYLNQVAGYIAALKAEEVLTWGADQVALFVVYGEMARQGHAPHFGNLPTALFDEGVPPDGTLWLQKCAPEHPAFERHRAAMATLTAGRNNTINPQ